MLSACFCALEKISVADFEEDFFLCQSIFAYHFNLIIGTILMDKFVISFIISEFFSFFTGEAIFSVVYPLAEC